MFCESCGAKLDVKAKFCGGCGAPAPKKDALAATHLTTEEVIQWLAEEGEDLDDGVYKVVFPVADRSQAVLIGVQEDEDGDTSFDKLTIFSGFATTRQVDIENAVAAVEDSNFGMKLAGDTYVLHTIAHVEEYVSLQGIMRLALWVGIAADGLEENLLGTDEF